MLHADYRNRESPTSFSCKKVDSFHRAAFFITVSPKYISANSHWSDHQIVRVNTCIIRNWVFTEHLIFPSFVVIPACFKRESILFRLEGYPFYTAGMMAKAGGDLTWCMTRFRGQATTREAQKKEVGHATRSNPRHNLPVSSIILETAVGCQKTRKM